MPKSFLITVLVLVALVGAFASFSVLKDQFSRVAYAVAVPLWKGEGMFTAKAKSILSVVQSKQLLLKENARLEDEMRRLKAEMLSLFLLKKENDELRHYLGATKVDATAILAFVLVRPNRSPYDTLIVDRGGEDGLHVGDLVSAPGGVAIGTVTFVSGKTAKVTLFSSPGEKAVVEIGASALRVDAVGQGGGNFEAKLPRGIEVKKGDLVSLIEKRRIVLGIVESIKAEPADSFQILLFKLPVNIYELEWVEITKKQSLD
ncbi:MAG: rod shape-determining protein MreC [Parcubacteria group bacterium]|nr:rod shape-determining protein MreC [Parcubacteria group bacterium]